jgi:hypothetical protein
MGINKMEFVDLEKTVSETGKPFRELLAPELGKAYVIAISRDNCPSCVKQKPKLDNLARTMLSKHRNNVVFTRIHINRPPDSEEESIRSKSLLEHYFYPTNLILIRTKDKGAVECYRNIEPKMSELKQNIEILIKLAVSIKKNSG